MTELTSPIRILFIGGPLDGEITRCGDEWWEDVAKERGGEDYAYGGGFVGADDSNPLHVYVSTSLTPADIQLSLRELTPKIARALLEP